MSSDDQLTLWTNEAAPAEERLVAFQRWLACQLQELLVWPRDEASQTRQIGQCRAFIERAVADLDRHGFLFEGDHLARLITEQLEYIASYQREGSIRDIYKYLERAWDNWVGRQAEELAAAARMAGVHRSQIVESRPPSMPELVRRNLEAALEEKREPSVSGLPRAKRASALATSAQMGIFQALSHEASQKFRDRNFFKPARLSRFG